MDLKIFILFGMIASTVCNNEASANDGTQTMQDNIYVHNSEDQRTDKHFAPSKDIYLEDELVGLSKYPADELNDDNGRPVKDLSQRMVETFNVHAEHDQISDKNFAPSNDLYFHQRRSIFSSEKHDAGQCSVWSFTCQDKKTDRSDSFQSKSFYDASKDCPKECCKYDKCDRYEIWGSLCVLYSNSVKRKIHSNPTRTLCSRRPVSGNWGKWSDYSDCSMTCGEGEQIRTRSCNNPSPRGFGAVQCLLSDGSWRRRLEERESRNCYLQSCPVNGNWGEWSDYSDCSITCGGGEQQRTRLCNNPSAARGGLDCLLSDGSDLRGKEERESRVCNVQSCPVPTVLPTTAPKSLSKVEYDSIDVKRDNLIHTFPILPKIYTVSFDLKQTQRSGRYTNVIHFTTGNNFTPYGSRIPILYVSPWNKLYVYSDVNTRGKNIEIAEIKKDEWVSMKFEYSELDSQFYYTIYYNGEQLHREINNNPQEFKDVKVYASDPWYAPFHGEIRNFKVVFDNTSPTKVPTVLPTTAPKSLSEVEYDSIDVKRDNLIHTFSILPKIYTVSFDLKMTQVTGYGNVIHFTTGNNWNLYGSRIPALYFQYTRLYVYSDVNRRMNYKSIDGFPKDKWVNMKLEYSKVGPTYYYTIYYNGVQNYRLINNKPQVFKDVKLYASDPWYKPFVGEIRNFKVVFDNTN